eukprot:Tbor_TRINITY_DN5884_c5_g8::TRINITY_DN5884_c5_g8_i1::g.7180::m.7180
MFRSGGSRLNPSSMGRCSLFKATPSLLAKSINNVTLVGVVHDIQSGYVYEDPVTQFTLTTTSIDTANTPNECYVEKDHHTVRCFGDMFSSDIKARIKEGNVVCVNGRLRMNPQLEPSCNKHFYFPFVHVQPPHGQVSIVHGDRRKPPPMAADSTSSIDGPLTKSPSDSTEEGATLAK